MHTKTYPIKSPHTARSIPNLPLELFRLQCAIDCMAIPIEHTVRADLSSGAPRSGARVQIDASNAGQQQVDDAELQLNRDGPACGPQQEIRGPRQQGKIVGWRWWRFVGGHRCRYVVIGIGERQHNGIWFVVIRRRRGLRCRFLRLFCCVVAGFGCLLLDKC